MTAGVVLAEGRVSLRLVTDADAALIVRLRNTPKASILPRGAQTVEDQLKWLRQYREREQAGTEYYFMILLDGRPVGSVRLYHIDRTLGTYAWGSWVIEEGSPLLVSLLTVRLLYDFAFRTLGLKLAQFDARVRNTNVIRFHLQLGAIRLREDELDVFFDYSSEQYEAARPRLQALIARC